MILLIVILFLGAGLLSLHSFHERRNRIAAWYVLGIILVFVAGMRAWDGVVVDHDYRLYRAAFHNWQAYSIEPTFKWLAATAHFLGGEQDAELLFFIFYAAIGVMLKFAAIPRLTELWFLSAMVYLGNFYMLHEMTQIRVGVASGLFLLALVPLYRRQFWRFFLLCSLATLFHYSSLILFLLWVLHTKTIRQRAIYLIIIPLSYVLFLIGMDATRMIALLPIPFIEQKVELYNKAMSTGQMTDINIFNAFQLTRTLVVLFLVYKSHVIERYNKYAPMLIKIYVWGVACFVIFAKIPAFGFRISELLSIVEIVAVPMIAYAFIQKRLSMFFAVMVASIFLFINLFYAKLIF